MLEAIAGVRLLSRGGVLNCSYPHPRTTPRTPAATPATLPATIRERRGVALALRRPARRAGVRGIAAPPRRPGDASLPSAPWARRRRRGCFPGRLPRAGPRRPAHRPPRVAGGLALPRRDAR